MTFTIKERGAALVAGLCLSTLASAAAPAPAPQASDDATTREIYGLAEEQAMLARQIKRLGQTINILASRLEAEGRTHAVELLREGLAVIDPSDDAAASLTLNERMAAAQEELSSGLWGKSLERQQAIIQELESLLEILLDRQNLNKLEERIAELVASKQQVEALSQRQAKLREATEQAHTKSFEAKHGAWQAALDQLRQTQAKLLKETEARAHGNGALERALILKQLEGLAEREERIAELLESWVPLDQELLDQATAEFAKQAAEARSTGDEKAAADLEAEAERLKAAAAEHNFLPQAAAGAQAENARNAEDLQAALKRLEGQRQAKASPAEKAAMETATKQLEQAIKAMTPSPSTAPAAAARSAQAALKSAAEALQAASQAAAGPAAAEQAQSQADLAEEAHNLQDDSASLEAATKAMQAAAEALSQGRLPESAEAQRQAIDALDQALRDAKTQSQLEQTAAEELAAQQEAIADDLLKLAMRLKEAEHNQAAQALDSAANAGEQAQQALQDRDASGAQEAERKVEEELDKALKDLKAEEEKYQKLRAEEVLIKLTEELEKLLAEHQTQQAEVIAIDGLRAGSERLSRSQKFRLRSIAREEQTLSVKAATLVVVLAKEDSQVFANAMLEVQEDLERAALRLGPPGESGAGAGFDSGWRTQALMADAERLLQWLLAALKDEAQRRQANQEAQSSPQQESGEEGENRLVQGQAELRLLRSMELDIQRSLKQTLQAYPELADLAPADTDPLVLDDLMRLAGRHNRITKLFRAVAERLGVPGMEASEGDNP